MNWIPILSKDYTFGVLLKTLPKKGNLVYEYNPFRNYRLTLDMYEYKGYLYTLDELEKFGITTKDNKNWIGVTNDIPVLKEKGELVDFITDLLSFSLDHPVNIIPQYSYDGSVNLILNDGINTPKLINSRFSATGRNTYEIIDRTGNNDTNIYDLGDEFELDTSLYKRVTSIPKITYNGTYSGGNLKVGNYFFYFKLSDADGNETDFIGESGLVSVFIGSTPRNIHTGLKNENSTKNVNFLISNLDTSYNYLIVYYSRTTAEGLLNPVTEYMRIDKKFTINNAGISNIVITGFEETLPVTAADINTNYNIVDSAKTQAVCLNMLFLGNVHKPEIPYKELQDLSLRFLPYLKEERYECDIDHEYSINSPSSGYYDTKFIYEKTGYWGNELYRFGIVYILNNGELTPVFNIRGGVIGTDNTNFLQFPIFKDSENKERLYISYNEESFKIYTDGSINNPATLVLNENIKGVVKLIPDTDTNTIYGIGIKVDDDVIKELKKYVRGFFFVRLTRIPTILTQGITIGIDKISRTPCIPTAHGVLETIQNSLEKTHVTTKDISDVNYISEGFLHRYSFKFKKKSSNLWSKIGKITAIVGTVVAVAVATVYTGGTAGAILAPIAGSLFTSTSISLGTAALITGIATGATALTMATAAGIQDLRNYGKRKGSVKELNGRNTKTPEGYEIAEEDKSRKLVQNFNDRIIIKDPNSVEVKVILCPDYNINLAYYNSIFIGHSHKIELTKSLGINITDDFTSSNYFNNDYRHFYIPNYNDFYETTYSYTSKIIGVPDGIKAVGLSGDIFRSRSGSAEEAWRYEDVGISFKDELSNADSKILEVESKYKSINSDIIRGNFGPYLAVDNDQLMPAETVNIYTPGFEKLTLDALFDIRQSDNSPFFAISDRMSIEDVEKQNKSIIVGDIKSEDYNFVCYRGDCYLCLFTHRLNRNFNDPTAPYNDEIVDPNTWKNNFDPNKTENYAKINLGDVNAVQLGMWVTFRVRSSNNLNIRTLDGSNVDEVAMTGHQKGFYPYYDMITEGTFKHSDSQVYNKGFLKSVGDKWNFETPDVPYIKNWFGTRIMYSDIHVNDAYKNGFRVFLGTNYRDYTREYGEIVKLIPFESSLLCVFEHGVAMIPVNERAVAGQGSGGNVYINTSNVLPENPKIISDMFGSQWPDSILKVPGKTGEASLYVYGVDTIAKKIWRTDGNTLQCISDFKVLEFLNNNITLGERELTPILGVRNVKTFYNAFKKDVMFTFYDNTYGFEEKVWNLCWNETLLKFITFYSWVPSFMENINNIPFSFNRDTSKWIAKLGISHTNNSFSDGITLSNVTIPNYQSITKEYVNNFQFEFKYISKYGTEVSKTYEISEDDREGFIGVLSLSNRIVPNTFYTVKYNLERDNYLNYKYFDIVPVNIKDGGGLDTINGIEYNTIKLPEDAKYAGYNVPIYALKFKSSLEDYLPVYYIDPNTQEYTELYSDYNNKIKVCIHKNINNPTIMLSELYYRNKLGNAYADYDDNKIEPLSDRLIPITIITKDNIHSLNKDALVGAWTGEFWGEGEFRLCEHVDPPTVENLINALAEDNDYVIRPGNGELDRLDKHAVVSTSNIHFDYPIFKDITGKRIMLPKELQINPDKVVTLLNIKANISIIDIDELDMADAYYNNKATYAEGTSLIDAGYYESTVAITTDWNLQFLSTDFWKHGQAGIIDIADDIYPTYWYGKQHPFEFECIVVNDPSVHKIFTNIELIANKAKPESFHYEIVGESYDFAKDKVNMYFRQEAMKALWLYNGADICYNRDFLKVQPKQQPKSADLIHTYYSRQDTLNEIEDYYIKATYPEGYDYKHLSGAELVYYKNRNEYRIWQHSEAVDIDNLNQEDARSLIAGNCRYLEDKWRVTINPILVCYKNEYNIRPNYNGGFALISPINSSWTDKNRPKLPIYNSPIPTKAYNQILNEQGGNVNFPEVLIDLNYTSKDIDTENWLNSSNIYGTSFGEALNRKELDLKDKFMKVRIRYTGDELAIINFLNTIYRVSYV